MFYVGDFTPEGRGTLRRALPVPTVGKGGPSHESLLCVVPPSFSGVLVRPAYELLDLLGTVSHLPFYGWSPRSIGRDLTFRSRVKIRLVLFLKNVYSS